MTPGATPSQTAGPFFRCGLDWMQAEELVPAGAAGAIVVEGTVWDGAGQPVPDAMLEIWQADVTGGFPGPGEPGDAWFGRSLVDPAGHYHFVTVGPGQLGTQAPHLELTIFARGLVQKLHTRIYFPDHPAANSSDPLLCSIADRERRATLVAIANGRDSFGFDVHLQGDRETVFFDR